MIHLLYILYLFNEYVLVDAFMIQVQNVLFLIYNLVIDDWKLESHVCEKTY